ncbi:BirA family transcriptional regulator, biotin operon repressor / biotin-[acetyl-CoA-carboxylase] ligase [Robiginitalea myxolifaciens]|uniref:biotin--[biotin carboxyl-carrier protein] ligase n=1 Tax=Robiginitalea myxolifaciens TaxID=400055 RepID=A0A1I6FPA8_9FLAO|nr:biotin--[acetyl-CoA-carboxylase] ligase [Robiginitalea myxolifaciens]SFR31775.1 BirA family transcriptional regulator, biotin operon repressor / biotin-[acetyl-CoA-carboxylase] ligase [Robiginitalea myxolifaciens]
MNLIKLSAIDSTNAELRRRLQQDTLPDLTVVWALEQTQGKGQRGATWTTDKGKNMTFSILKRFKALEATDHFRINMSVSNALIKALSTLNIPALSIKWPNDILSGRHKICGILPENSLTGNRILYSIIGIGLNVNQEEFPGLPQAGSLLSTTGTVYDLDDVFLRLYASLTTIFAQEENTSTRELRQAYLKNLFGYGQTGSFQIGDEILTGQITGVDREGRLLLKMEDGREESFGMKEIKFRY